MKKIQIQNYKSIKDLEFELQPINILIGPNGAGKSNFLSFFEFLNHLYQQKLKEYIALKGGVEKIIYGGIKMRRELSFYINFNDKNGYSCRLKIDNNRNFTFKEEVAWYYQDDWILNNWHKEAIIKTDPKFRSKYIRDHLKNFKKYHFHDTSSTSAFSDTWHIENDPYFLYNNGGNIAALLYKIREKKPRIYQRIVFTIQSIAPYFSDFFLEPNQAGYIRLQWTHKHNETIYGANDFSDGTMRFIALTVLFMQPNVPETIIIDEPELGLHPTAVTKLSGMIKSVATEKKQVIIATQSADFINHFDPENIVTVTQEKGESKFERLNKEKLSIWLEDYSVGDLWQQNMINGGCP